MSAIEMMKRGLEVDKALSLGIVNKCFDAYERQLVSDMIQVRFPGNLDSGKVFKA